MYKLPRQGQTHAWGPAIPWAWSSVKALPVHGHTYIILYMGVAYQHMIYLRLMAAKSSVTRVQLFQNAGG